MPVSQRHGLLNITPFKHIYIPSAGHDAGNEPIVNTAKEALDCYLRTDMDVLVLENYVVERVKS